MLNKKLVAIVALACYSCVVAVSNALHAEESAKLLTNQEAWRIYETYLSGWNSASEQQRVSIATEVVAADAWYSTPRHASGGRTTIIEDMATFQKKYPGSHFEIGDVSAHHDSALLTWVMIQPDGKEFARGHDGIRVSAAGKIVSVITFAPSVLRPSEGK
jgi:hypothetical protein